jgi:hypothetical protein
MDLKTQIASANMTGVLTVEEIDQDYAQAVVRRLDQKIATLLPFMTVQAKVDLIKALSPAKLPE